MNSFLDAWRAGDREAMYALTGARWRARETREDFDLWLDRLDATYGKLGLTRLADLERGVAAGQGEYLQLVFEAEFESIAATITFSLLTQPDGTTAIEGVSAESPLTPLGQ